MLRRAVHNVRNRWITGRKMEEVSSSQTVANDPIPTFGRSCSCNRQRCNFSALRHLFDLLRLDPQIPAGFRLKCSFQK